MRVRVTVERPCTVGLTHEEIFECFADAEDWFERKAERLADKGWELSDLDGSTVESGAYEATHDDVADRIVVRWRSIPDPIVEAYGDEAAS